jgi:hypothetical protein
MIYSETRSFCSSRTLAIKRAALVATVATAASCAALDFGTMFPWWTANAEKSVPARIAVVWTAATKAETGKTVMRGFRGEIQFYPKDKIPRQGQEKNEHAPPMKVEGTITVYAFDETPGTKIRTAPPRKFVFDPDQLKKCSSDSKTEHRYTVWVPWDTAGGPTRQIRLLVRFDSAEEGPVVMSDPSRNLLSSNPGAQPSS